MPQVTYPAFVRQSNGVTYICNGEVEAVFDTVADFAKAEPGQLLTPGIVAVNFERRGDLVLAISILDDGATQPIPEEEWPAYDAMIAKAADYAAMADQMAKPLYGVTDVVAARAILAQQVVGELERRTAILFAAYPAHERDTFERQLSEARTVIAAAGAPDAPATPLLSALLLDGETLADLAAAILAHADDFTATMGALLGAKRRHLAAIWAAGLEDLQTYDVAAGWPV
ncbi:MAG: hypothetical protein H7Z12_15065 [Rhodospirillaceae bacterium]|nr:hypothetical protein [Rhodospirillales bacterium]